MADVRRNLRSSNGKEMRKEEMKGNGEISRAGDDDNGETS